MMKRKEPEKGGSRSILGAIPLDLNKLTRLPAKIVVTHHHQKEEVFCGEDDESRDKSPPGNKIHAFLPLDLEAETLIRLPGKSLMKCLCVSKTWSSLIRSQRFVASYYAAKPSRFVVAFTNSDDPRRLFILSGEEKEDEETSSSLVANLDMTVPSVVLAGGYKYFSVHGFIACCFLYEFIVCNPSTGQVITFHCKERGTSLGYDPVGDQFKALTHVTSMCDHMHDPNIMVHEVITLGGGGVVSRTRFTSPYYRAFTSGLCINGFMYYGASAPSHTSVPTLLFVCFDVRNERILSFITTPQEVLSWKGYTSLIDYKGKLAVVHVPTKFLGTGTGGSFDCFDLWILEDATNHEWSRQSFHLPSSLPFGFHDGQRMNSQGANKAGEIIFSPASLPGRAQPFYLFYFNPVTNTMRRGRIHGVADTEEFWSRYGLTGTCCVSFAPQHHDNIAFL